jgi:hypothetical protein
VNKSLSGGLVEAFNTDAERCFDTVFVFTGSGKSAEALELRSQGRTASSVAEASDFALSQSFFRVS